MLVENNVFLLKLNVIFYAYLRILEGKEKLRIFSLLDYHLIERKFTTQT
jgi:hypothetical protein